MTVPPDSSTARESSSRTILSRFAHLTSAQGIEGVLQFAFFLYLVWIDKILYGEVMYAMAAGGIVMKVVQFGLYYPLVSRLGESEEDAAPALLSQVNAIRLGLFLLCMLGIGVLAWYQGFSPRMSWIVLLISAGWAVEVIAETFFADMRVRGRQKEEARIRVVASVGSYGYGIATAALGLHPLVLSLFKIASGAMRLGLGIKACLSMHGVRLFVRPGLQAIKKMFGATVIFALIEIFAVGFNKVNIFFLENVAGAKGVADYSATYNIVDGISILASQQLLGWVIFPFLSVLWWQNRERVAPIVSTTAAWLIAIAFPIMFVLHTESDLIIGLLYPPDCSDAAWMQRYLVWTILFSFVSNLFFYLMTVAGAARILLFFVTVTLLTSIGLSYWLVDAFQLAGVCLVLVLIKGLMAALTAGYCQARFRLFKVVDFAFVAICPVLCVGIFVLIKPLVTYHPAVVVALGLYLILLWQLGAKFMGSLARKSDAQKLKQAKPLHMKQ